MDVLVDRSPAWTTMGIYYLHHSQYCPRLCHFCDLSVYQKSHFLYLDLVNRCWQRKNATELESTTKDTAVVSSTKAGISNHSSEEHLAM